MYKSSALVGVTLRDHLIGIHMLGGNILTTAIAEQVCPPPPTNIFPSLFLTRTVPCSYHLIIHFAG